MDLTIYYNLWLYYCEINYESLFILVVQNKIQSNGTYFSNFDNVQEIKSKNGLDIELFETRTENGFLSKIEKFVKGNGFRPFSIENGSKFEKGKF